MKSTRSSLASRYSVAFILCLSCSMILMASAISGSRTSPLATAASARAEASATPTSGEPVPSMLASPLAPLSTTVTATKSHTPSGNRAPGDSLFYTVVITNTGAQDAMGVNFTDTIDPNTMLVGGSLKVSPIAVNDTYNTIGNVNISVPAGSGLLSNDLNPGGMGTLTITAFDATSAHGGTVTVNTTDGSFTYNPAAGFAGPTDTFTYTLGNGTGLTDSATVTINIAGMIWFVDNSPGAPGSAPGDGRLTNPFRSFGGASSFNTIATDAANDAIFIYTGTSTYTGGVTLLSGQKLIGQGAGASILSITGFSTPSGTNLLPGTSGTNPTIAAGVDNITLGSGNTVRGVTLNVTAVGATALTGSSFGTLTLAETTIGGTNGRALSLTTGTLTGPVSSTAAFTSISSTNSSLTGITLTSVGGAMSSGSTTITNPTGIGLSVNTSSAAFNFATTSSTGSGGTGISLLTNTGTITFGALTITPDASQRGLLATDNTMTITANSGGTVTTSGATAVEITKSSTTTPLLISLTSVTANGGTNGIKLLRTSGSFIITGDGASDPANTTRGRTTAKNGGGTVTLGSGGTINNTTGPAVSLDTTTNVTLQDLSLTGNAGGLNSGADGINAVSSSGLTLDNMLVTGHLGNDGLSGSAVSDLNLLHMDIHTNAKTAGVEASDIWDVRLDNLTGTSAVSNSLFFDSREDIFTITNNGSSNLTLTVTNSEFRDTDLGTTPAVGDAAFQMLASGSAVTTLTATGSTFKNARLTGFHYTGNNTASGTVKVMNSVFGGTAAGGDAANQNGVDIDIDHQGQGTTLNFEVSGNTTRQGFRATTSNSINIFLAGLSTATSQMIGTVKNNIVGNAGVANSGSDLGAGIALDCTGAGTMTASVTGNTVNQVKANSGNVFDAGMSQTAKANLKIRSNTFNGNPAQVNPQYGLHINNGTGTPGETGVLCLDIGANSVTMPASAIASVDLDSFPGTNTNLIGYGGAANNVAQITAFLGTPNNTVATPAALYTAAGGSTQAAVAPCSTFVFPTFVDPVLTIQSAHTVVGDANADSSTQGDSALRATWGEALKDSSINKLTQAELIWMVQAALERWRQAGISAEDLARLQAVVFDLADLPDGELATPDSGHVKIDETAAGYGWYFDQTPNEDSEFDVPVPGKEFQATQYSPAHGKIDLLTVVMRELGSVYLQGKKRIPIEVRPLMETTLSPSVRRLPDPALVQIPQPQFDLQSATQTAPVGSGSASPASGSSSTRRRSGTVQTASKLIAQSGETVSQALGTIPAGEKITLKFQVTINNPLPPNVCVVTNPAVGSPANVTGTGFSAVTIAPDTATIVTPITIGSCPAHIDKFTDMDACTAVATFTTPTADGCPVPTVTCLPASGFAFVKGTTTVTCTATNGSTSAMCTFTVTVTDIQPPTINCPSPVTHGTDLNVCTAVVTYAAPSVSDNCPGVGTPSCLPTSGSTFAKGVTTVNCSVMDASGNSNTCSFTVTVTDNQAPVVTCPPSGGAFAASDCLPSQSSAYTGATLYSTGGNMVTNVVLFGFSPCTAPPVSGTATINFTGILTGDITIPPSGSTHFQAPVTGSMKVTFINLTVATRTFDTEMLQLDISGGNLPAGVQLRESPTLASTGQTKITTVTGGFHIDSFFDVFTELTTNGGLIWTPDPTARHISAVQSTDAGACNAVVNYPAATATDNCDTVTPTCVPASGTTFNKGVTTVTCSATDTSNLTGNCTFTVTVLDTQLPTLTCPSNISVIGNACSVQNYTPPTASDNCPSPTVNCTPAPGFCFVVGTTTVTCTATDMSGNTGSCSFTVTVTPCTITCPGSITDNTAPGTCAQVEMFPAPMTTGQCGTVTCSPVSGSSFPKGVTTVTCSTTAGPSCTFTVTINDNEAPTITCPNPITQNTDLNLCTAVVSFTPTVNDNCSGATPSCSPTSGSVFSKGVTTVFCKAIDASLHPSPACTFTVTVVDNQAPTVVCPGNISKNTDLNLCTAVATYVTPTGSDNCAVQSVVCSPASGTAFPKGITTVTCTVTDTANLTGACARSR